jgi:hypothetical protein
LAFQRRPLEADFLVKSKLGKLEAKANVYSPFGNHPLDVDENQSEAVAVACFKLLNPGMR